MLFRKMFNINGIFMEMRVLSYPYRLRIANFISSGWVDKCWNEWQGFQELAIEYHGRCTMLEAYMTEISENKQDTCDLSEYAMLALLFYGEKYGDNKD